MNPQPYRHEIKHIITVHDAMLLRSHIRPFLRMDRNCGPTGTYHIRSLYFDDDNDSALQEKLSGVKMREKFRIRLYNHQDAFIRLECKKKNNQGTLKLSARLTRQECDLLLNGDIAWMRNHEHLLVRELYAKMQQQGLKPKTLVDYTREAYIYSAGNVRVTLDTDIRSGLAATDLFSSQVPTLLTDSPGMVVLEVKYDSYLPDFIRDLLQLGDRRATALSKYAACRQFQ